jgi:DNA-binding IclR family transcriptional regulator
MAAIKTPTVPALDRALCLLELLAQSRAGLTLAELVSQSGMARSSVHYLLVTFERRGYVLRNKRTSRYLFSRKFFALANSTLQFLDVRQQAAPHLTALQLRTNLTVHFAILEGTEAVLVSKQEPADGTVATWPGKRLGVHCTALGKALLASLPAEEATAILRAHRLPRHNENTITDLKRLCDDLERTVQLGYAVDDEEAQIGVRCIGAAIPGRGEQPPVAISVAGSAVEINSDNSAWLAAEVKRATSLIALKTGAAAVRVPAMVAAVRSAAAC